MTTRKPLVVISGSTQELPTSDTFPVSFVEVGNYPSLRPSLLIDFANSQVFDPRITFTRNSVATRINSRGLYELVPANTPRISFDPITLECLGFLTEEARTNLFLYSEQFDNAAWTKSAVTISPNVGTAPDGVVSADKLIPDNAATLSGSFFRNTTILTVVASTTYAVTLFTSANGFNRCRLYVVDSANTANNSAITVSLVDGSVVTSAAAGNFTLVAAPVATLHGAGMYRVTLVFTTGAGVTGLYARVYAQDSVATVGDGVSGINIWGSQLEKGSLPSSYIPTTTVAFPRAADYAVLLGANFTSWYRADEGTIFVEGSTRGSTGFTASMLFALSDSGSANVIYIGQNTASPFAVNFVVITAASNQASMTSAGLAGLNTFFKVAGAFKANDFKYAAKGVANTPDTSGTVPVVDRMYIGASYNGANRYTNGHIKSLRFYPQCLTSAELEALTTQ